MGTPFAVTTRDPFTGQTLSSAPTPGTSWFEFITYIDSDNFAAAGRMISEKRIDTQFHSDFYDSKIKELLLQVTEASKFDLDPTVDRNANLRKVLRVTEFFDSKGIESTYCRVCRAAVYLYLNEQSKLEALLPVLCRPRGYREASDLLQLNELMNNWDEREMRITFFVPLHGAIIEHLEKSAKFPITSIGGKA